jgi:predicted nucleic acid-binding protein
MKDNYFLDTNIWVYAHLKEVGNNKHDLALNILQSLPTIVTSTQVLNEYYSVLLKKKVSDVYIQDNIEVIIDIAQIEIISIKTIRLAHQFKLKYAFSYWDSLILATAFQADCQIIYSEDMQHQQVIENKLIIFNPFKDIC